MGIKEFRESGLLELYLIGACGDDEMKVVEKALKDYPELQNDIAEISKGLQGFAQVQGHRPSAGLKDKIMDAVDSPSNSTVESKSGGKTNSWLTSTLGVAALVLGGLGIYLNSQLVKKSQALDQLQQECEERQAQTEMQFAWIQDIQNENSKWIDLTATDKYNQTEIILVNNNQLKKNYLQVINIPNITSQQSFQLWSLKPDQAPIPLTVFQGDESTFIPVDFEDGTPTYAITIEPFGGVESPTLENLVGTMTI